MTAMEQLLEFLAYNQQQSALTLPLEVKATACTSRITGKTLFANCLVFHQMRPWICILGNAIVEQATQHLSLQFNQAINLRFSQCGAQHVLQLLSQHFNQHAGHRLGQHTLHRGSHLHSLLIHQVNPQVIRQSSRHFNLFRIPVSNQLDDRAINH